MEKSLYIIFAHSISKFSCPELNFGSEHMTI